MTVTQPNPLEALTLEQLRGRTSEKWQHYPADVLPLWVAEMDVSPAQPVLEAVNQAMVTGDTGYPAGDTYPRALRSFARQRWGWDAYDLGRMRTATDVMTAVTAAVSAMTAPQDPVIVCSPVYPPFYGYLKVAGRRVLEAPLDTHGRLDPATLREALTTARSTTTTTQPVLLLANPHNPTGVAHTRSELTTVAELAGEFGARVVADEIHAPLVLGSTEFIPWLSVSGAENGMSVFSASKAWNLPGLKAAVISAGPEAARDLRRIPGTLEAGTSHLGVLAHSAALEHGTVWLDALLSGLTAQRDLLVELLDHHLPAVRMRPPEATYLAWLDCTDLALPDPAPDGRAAAFRLGGPAGFFLDHAAVALNDGATFGTGGHGHVRLNFATSSTILRQAVTAMGQALGRRA